MTLKPALLVLCTGNSCRSQMAEALLRRHAGDRFEVHSAGTEPAARVHPLAVRVMAEIGLDLSGQVPKHLDAFAGKVKIHTTIIVCDGASRSCPGLLPGATARLFWPFEDPAAFVGSEEATLAKFREIRDAIETRIRAWVEPTLASDSP